MATLESIHQIQSYLRESARSQYQSVALPPFTLFFHPHDSLKYFNYAIPDQPCGGDLSAELAHLKREYQQRGRVPRFEFFEAFAPDLPAALRANGFVEEARQWSMLCLPDQVRSVPEVPGLEVVALNEQATDKDIRDFIIAQREGFDPGSIVTPSEEDLRESREGFQRHGFRGFLARVDGQPAGVSAYGRPIHGVTEVAGIATREAFRRRGIAALLTEQAVRAAFAEGAQTVCLTAADADAGRVYEKVGFQPFSIMLAYIDQAAA